MPNPKCLPATNIQATLADLHGTADNIVPATINDNWAGATVTPGTPDFTPHTYTNSNFAGMGITVIETGGRTTATPAGGNSVGHESASPGGTFPITIDLGAPRTNVQVYWGIFQTTGGKKFTNISPPVSSVTGAGVSVSGGTGVNPTSASPGSMVMHFAGPVQNITMDVTLGIGTASLIIQSFIFWDDLPKTLNLALGTVSGGPYPTQLPSPGTPGNNTLNQPVDETVTGLAPNTTYFYRQEVRDGNGNLLESSAECSFTTAALPSPPSADCNGVTGLTSTSASFNGTLHDADPGDPNLWNFVYGVNPGGPYPFATGQAVVVGGANEPVNVFQAGLTPGTVYYFATVITLSDGTTVVAQSTECTFTTPGSQCGAATAVTATTATLNGTIIGSAAGDQYRFRYGTVSGGPYGVTVGPFPAADGSVSQPIVGLTGSTVYYSVLELLDAGNVVLTISPECTLLTSSSAPVPTGQVNCGHDVFSDWDCFTYTVDGAAVTQCYPPGVNDWNPLG